MKGGFVGVDIFFVLSGYLITTLLRGELERSGTISLLDFYARRARRLLPAATLVLLTTLGLTSLLAPEATRPEFALDGAAAAAYFANWHFSARSVDYLSEDLGRSPFLHFWSLSVEEQFYFVWPALMLGALLLAKRFRIAPYRVIASVAATICVLSFASALQAADSSAEDFFATTNRAWELGVGALFALMPVHWASRRARTIASAFGAALIIASFVGASAHDWPSLPALAPTLGTALILVTGSQAEASSPTAIHRLLSKRPLVWLGGLSYSLYIWHWPLLILGQDWLGLKGPAWGSLLTVISIGPAWLSYRFVEAPLRSSKFLSSSPLGTLSFGLNLSLLAVACGVVSTVILNPDGGAPASSIYLGVRDGKVSVDPPKAGALALGSSPRKTDSGKPRKAYDLITPDPELATMDVPRAYAEGCQIPTGETTPVWCSLGDPKGATRGVIVGDSKILQYYEALDAVGQAVGMSLLAATKSACAFAPVFGGDSKQDDDECHQFTRAVLAELRETRPDFIITSQRDSKASSRSGDEKQTRQEMVTGLRSLWGELVQQGTQVIVVVDNPTPEGTIYQCMLDHPGDSLSCAFSRKEGIKKSAAEVQREAAAGMEGVILIDPTDFICPRDRCAPVIGSVLVYRQGSHVTNSYARTLAPFFEHEFRDILKRRGTKGTNKTLSN